MKVIVIILTLIIISPDVQAQNKQSGGSGGQGNPGKVKMIKASQISDSVKIRSNKSYGKVIKKDSVGNKRSHKSQGGRYSDAKNSFPKGSDSQDLLYGWNTNKGTISINQDSLFVEFKSQGQNCEFIKLLDNRSDSLSNYKLSFDYKSNSIAKMHIIKIDNGEKVVEEIEIPTSNLMKKFNHEIKVLDKRKKILLKLALEENSQLIMSTNKPLQK